MTRRNFYLAALAAAALGAQPTGAQGVSVARGWTLRQWTIDDGLPQSTVNSIHQGPDGYLWLATNGGLARFDGMRFETFSHARHPGLGSDRLLAIDGSADGTLWIGSEQGLIRRDARGFRTWRAADGLPSDIVSAVLVDSTGGVWAGTHNGLVHFVGDSMRIYGTTDGLRAPGIAGVYADADGRIWVNTAWTGTAPWHAGVLDTARSRALWNEGISDFIGRDALGHRWHRHRTWGMLAREVDGAYVTVASTLGGRRSNFVTAPVTAPDGALWYATLPDGELWRMGREALARRVPVPERVAVLHDRVHLLSFDREGNLWIGTEVRGLFSIRPQFVRTVTVADGLRSASVAALLPDRDGASMLVGGNCGALQRVRRGTVAPTPVAGLRTDVPCVWALANDSTGSLWVGLHGSGLLELRDDRVVRHVTTLDGLPANEVFSLLAARDGKLWVGTSGGLATLSNGRLGTWDAARGIRSPSIRAIVEDGDGTLWLGTVGGLGRIRGDSVRWWTAADGLAHDYVRAIVRDSAGGLWLGTYGGGLSHFDGARFTTVNAALGLPDDYLSAIVPDRRGWFWISSNHGIFRVSESELRAAAAGTVPRLSATLYDRADGMMNAEANGGFQPSGVRHSDGTLWFSTIEGVAVIDPERVADAAAPPRSWIEGATADGVALDISAGIEVPAGTRQLEIHYTAPTFTAPDKTRFRYRLEGFDPDWVEVGSRRVAYYTAPEPGQRRFLVGAANRGGDWTAEPTAVGVSVAYFLWQRWWFRPLLLLLAIGIVALVVRRRFAELAREHAQREGFARELLARQEGERKRIAGELHDGLSQDLLVVTNRSTLALRGDGIPGDARRHLEQIGGAAQGALENVRALARGLHPYQIDRLGLTQAIETQVVQAAEAAELSLDLTIAPMDDRFGPDERIHVFRIVQEAVNNVIKHAAARTLRVEGTLRDYAVLLRVQDDGRGFVPAGAEGFGMSGIAERVRLLGGTWAVDSAPGQGTEYRFVLPTSQRSVA